MKSYSPYDNVRSVDGRTPVRYPDILVTAGLSDPRVGFWEPAKWVAKLRAANPENRVLLKTELDAGHGGPVGPLRRLAGRGLRLRLHPRRPRSRRLVADPLPHSRVRLSRSRRTARDDGAAADTGEPGEDPITAVVIDAVVSDAVLSDAVLSEGTMNAVVLDAVVFDGTVVDGLVVDGLVTEGADPAGGAVKVATNGCAAVSAAPPAHCRPTRCRRAEPQSGGARGGYLLDARPASLPDHSVDPGGGRGLDPAGPDRRG